MGDPQYLKRRYVQLLLGLGDGKLRDGHWPLTPFECRAALLAGADFLGAADNAATLALPWGPTAFLNLYYGYALASYGTHSAGQRHRVGLDIMAALGKGRLDDLADEGRSTFAAVSADFDRLVTAAPLLNTDAAEDAYELVAVQAALAEAVGWFTHRVYSELHGPYPASDGRTYLVRTFNIDALPPYLALPLPGVARMHTVFWLDGVWSSHKLLDFFGHLKLGLRGIVTSVSAVLVGEDGSTLQLSGEIDHQLAVFKESLRARIAAVAEMPAPVLCGEFGRLFMWASLVASGTAHARGDDMIAEFPRSVEPGGRWTGSRRDFLGLLDMNAPDIGD